jgi:hypothetical protein
VNWTHGTRHQVLQVALIGKSAKFFLGTDEMPT